jgi:hypothetical protein
MMIVQKESSGAISINLFDHKDISDNSSLIFDKIESADSNNANAY